jgi:diguanylate cyclase (GGDEF)-like protein/PAS domain S-box-containing protein
MKIKPGFSAPICPPLELSTHDVLEMMPCVVFTLQRTGKRSAAMPYASGKLADLAGLDPQEIVRDATSFISRIDAEDIEQFFVAGEDSARSMNTWNMEFRLNHPTKAKVWVEWKANPVMQDGQLYWQGFMCDITERKRSELAQVKSEQAYRNLAESSPDFVIRYDLEHRIRYLNAKLVHELQLSGAEEVLGRHPIDVWPDGRFTTIDEAAREARETGREITVDLKHCREDGSTSDQQILVVPEYDANGRLIGTLAFGRDITKFKRLESQLSERHAFQRSLLYALNEVGMQLMVIENGQIIHVNNRRLAHEFGYRDDEIDAGIPVIDIIHPDDWAWILDIHNRSLAGEEEMPSFYEIGLQTKLGERREYEASITLIPESNPLRIVTIGKDITQRKRTERELRLLQHAVNQSSELLFITDSISMRFSIVNDATCRSLGYSREELQNMSYAEIDPNFSVETIRQTILTAEIGKPHVLETLHRRKDGSIFPVQLNGSFFENNGIRYAIGFTHDISERKRTENTLRFIAKHGGEPNFLPDLARHLSEALSVTCVVFERLSDEQCNPETIVFCANGTVLPDIHHALGDIPWDHFSDNGCFYPEGMLALLPKGSLLGDMGVDSCACLPLQDSTGRPIGRVAVMHSAPLRDQDAVMQLLQIVAPRAAAELERAESDRQLRLREQEFRSLAENSPDNIIRYDRECRQIYANPSVVETLMALLGRNPMGETPSEAYPDGSFREYDAALRRVIATGRVEDFAFMLPDRGEGAQYHMIRMAPEKNPAGEVIGVVAFGRDITTIREGEHRLRRFVDSLPGLAYSFHLSPDGHGTIPYLSAGVEALYGLKPEEAEGDMDTLYNLMHPQDRPRIDAALAESAQTLAPIHVEFRICPPDLPLRWIDAHAVPESQADGSLIWYGIMLNVTDRKQAQHRIYLLEYAMERMRDGSVLIDRQGRILDINRGLCDMLGYEKSDLLGGTMFDLNPNFTPETWDAHWDAVIGNGGVMQIETSNRTRDGYDIPTEVSISLFDYQGENYNLSTIRDITERRQNEAQLRMAASVFEAATEGITITDPTGRILDTNPAFSRISGYSRDEVLGKPPSILASGRHDQAYYQAMWQSLLSTGTWSGEIINRRKSGELYTEQLNIVTVADVSGKTKYYIGIFSDISLLKQHEQHLEHIAHHDDLTGLPNRLLLTDRLSHAIAQSHRNEQMLAVIYLDLDGFKPINDNHGHELGDRVLVEIARRLTESLRTSDTVARIGGDEFVVLLAGISDIGECEFTAHRMLEMIARPIMLEDHTLNVTASIGICLYPNDAQDDPDTLLRYADQAMYLAKSAGRNQFVFYDSYAQSNAQNHSQTIYDLHQAIKQNQISVHYQPILDLTTGRITIAEALARWHHPRRGMVPPAEFIPAAENGGLIHEIGDLVFRHAADTAQTWNNLGILRTDEQPHISINRSPRQFLNRNGINSWKTILNENGISGELVNIEITEGLLLDNRNEVLQQLKQMHALGMAISIDDFGTGYSSLSYLRKFNIDYLKIDRSFVQDIAEDPDDRAIVESIIVMAKRLGIKTVAEGVETHEQAEILKKSGCDMAQGYLFARPMPKAEFLEFIARV